MREWNKRDYLDRKAEVLYRVKRIQYAVIICILVSWMLIAPIMLSIDFSKVDRDIGSLRVACRELDSNYNVPEIALAKIVEIRILIDEAGLEPTDNSKYFGNSSTRDVNTFLRYLNKLEKDYNELLAWRNVAFSRGFNLSVYVDYDDRLGTFYDSMYTFGDGSEGSIDYIVYGAYLNKNLGPISLFNYRWFIYYIPYVLISLYVISKIKERLAYLHDTCISTVRRRYNTS